MLLDYRHCAYNVKTGEIITADKSNHLKRVVAEANMRNRRWFPGEPNSWRFCHDFGKSWVTNGFPTC